MSAGVIIVGVDQEAFGAARAWKSCTVRPAVPPETQVRSTLLTSAEQRSLVDRIRQGDGLAEEELVLRYSRRILWLAVNRTRDREMARDLVQDVLMQVLPALRGGQLRDAEKLGGFIFGIARNVINNHLRSRGRHPEEQIPDELEIADDEGDEGLAERMALVRRALQRLDATDQRILSMTLVEGCKPGEIASALGLSVDVVRARKSRGLKKVTDRVQRWLKIGS
jgi:RNA polymerase sigma-70 factor, ECF subfamily